eukprot:130416-Amphidinium_carterae.1
MCVYDDINSLGLCSKYCSDISCNSLFGFWGTMHNRHSVIVGKIIQMCCHTHSCDSFVCCRAAVLCLLSNAEQLIARTVGQQFPHDRGSWPEVHAASAMLWQWVKRVPALDHRTLLL